MRFRAVVSIGLLGLLIATATACSGGASSPGQAALPAAGTAAGQARSGPALGARRLGGVRRSITGCSGTGSGSFIGANNSNVAFGTQSGVVSGGVNDACDLDSGIVAGSSNTINSSGSATDEFIGGGIVNAISGGHYTFIGAGDSNAISGGNAAVIVGGISNAISAGDSSFIGAGNGNAISGVGSQAVIGGGSFNTNTANNGVVAGGQNNSVSAPFASIGGRYKGKASGQYASVAGGNTNTASGTESTVAGGGNNIASGYASFAAGAHANAALGGSFVWSDSSSSATTKATVANQFVARASGGVKFFSNAAMTTGVSLAAGGGSWSNLSDRAVKTDVQSIDDAQILDRVAAMPISEWSYISERGVRHVGPMAQDFYAAFGVGEDNKHITSIDEDGVALAAIKALNQKLAERDATLNGKIEAKDASLRALQHQMRAMKVQMAALMAKVSLIH